MIGGWENNRVPRSVSVLRRACEAVGAKCASCVGYVLDPCPAADLLLLLLLRTDALVGSRRCSIHISSFLFM